MKSFFTNLGKLLLCGATVAMIGCTDLHSDIALTDDLANANKEQIADLQSTLDQLEATLQKDYALKSELEAVQKELADEKAALEAAIAAGDAAAIAAAREELTAAVAAAKAEVEAAMGQLNDQIGQINGALGQVNTDLEGVYARLEALEAAEVPEEIAAQLAALDAYVLAMEEAIIGRLDTVEQALSAVTVLIEDEAAARQLADEELWTSIYGVQEVITALNNKVDDLAAQETVTAADLEAVYTSIYEAQASISSVYNQLLDLAAKHDQDVEEIYAKINVVEEALSALVFTVTDVQGQLAALEAMQGYIEELFLADQDMQVYFTQLLNSVNAQIEDLTAAQEEVYAFCYQLQEQYTQLYNALSNADEELRAEMESLISETKNELGQAVTFLTNLINDYAGQIDNLAARVQSLVFIPEYSDGKATIEWGLLIDNDSAVNFILENIVTRNNLVLFRDVVVDFLKEVKNAAIELGRPVVDYADKTIDNFISDLVNTEAMANALKTMLSGIEDIVAKEVAELYNEKFAEFGEEIAIPEGVPTVDELTKSIMDELYQSIDLSKLDIKKILKTIITKVTDKAYDLVSIDGIIAELKSIDIYEAIDILTSAEFEELLSELLQTFKSFEEKALSNTALLKKESVIRYKVMGQNATALAAAIAANPSVLSYDVEAVDVRAAAPGLEITKVVAKGDEIHVSVVPQNFHYRFYLTYILEDSFIYGAAESFFDKYGKTGLISYSAALVLNDGNNIRSTEYTNFVSAENPEIFTPEVIKNGKVVGHETINAVKGQVDEITLCEGMYMGYLSVPNRVILTKEQLEAKGYLGFTENKTVKTNDKGIAGPCQFNGLTGSVKSWFDYTFTTYWSVNDIVLTTTSSLVWDLPESVAVWAGSYDANDNKPISVSAEDIADWFDGLAVGQRLYFEFEVPTSSVACIHMYNSNKSSAVELFTTERFYEAGNYYLDLTITPALLEAITKTDEIVFAGSGFVMKSITLYL